MNDRINALLTQAAIATNNDPNGEYHADMMEKFAKLIVEECVGKIAKDFIPEEEIMEGYNDDWDSALRFAANSIKEFFGVE